MRHAAALLASQSKAVRVAQPFKTLLENSLFCHSRPGLKVPGSLVHQAS
jgi:hypothetical protein